MRTLLSPLQISEIIKLYQSGQGSDTIAKQFNIHPNSVLKVLKRNGIATRPFKRKVALSDYKQIGEEYVAGQSTHKLGAKYGVSAAIILKILRKENIETRNAEDTHRIYAINEDYFDTIDTPEKAYILGFTYADGCNIKEGNFISYDLNTKDIDVLQKIAERIYLDNPHDRVHNYVRERETKRGLKKFPYSVLTLNSKHICGVLDKLGCEPRKSLTTKFPLWLTDKELQRHFIRGYYDGDGGLFITDIKGRGALARIIGTTPFIDSCIDIIKKSVDTNIYVEVLDKGLRRLVISGNQQSKRFLDWLYQGSTIHLNRKFKLYQQLIQQMDMNNRTRKSNIVSGDDKTSINS